MVLPLFLLKVCNYILSLKRVISAEERKWPEKLRRYAPTKGNQERTKREKREQKGRKRDKKREKKE